MNETAHNHFKSTLNHFVDTRDHYVKTTPTTLCSPIEAHIGILWFEQFYDIFPQSYLPAGLKNFSSLLAQVDCPVLL